MCVVREGKGSVSRFCLWKTSFSTSCVKETVPFPLFISVVVKDQLTVNVWIYFWTLFCSIGLYVCFYASTGLFRLWGDASNFVLLFKIALAKKKKKRCLLWFLQSFVVLNEF